MSTAVVNNANNGESKSKKRQWIYAKKPQGELYKKRQWVGYSLLLFLFIVPFIKINGEPFLMFNIIERKFSILGNLFYPQDLYIFVFGMLIVMVCVVLFTVVFGRVWCGWTCPQTIFLELIFRRIEYWIEGDWQQQKKLDAGPNTDQKQLKKILKHGIFLIISFFISNIFLSYIIGVDALMKIITDPLDQHIGGLISIIIFTLVFYGVFAYVREIVCIAICPYGRLQGVLLDDQSITVAYDHRRGEPRGKQQKDAVTTQGDCVDCKLCVHVCPTGIDIRNGLQLECVSCTACIDACDAVMDKIGKPKKLIGFYPMGEIEGTLKKKSNTRAIAYSVVLVALMSVFGFLLFNRSQVDGRLLRAKGSTYQLRDDKTISNLYSLELINKSGKEMPFKLVCDDPRLKIQLVNPIQKLSKDGHATLSFFLIIANKDVETYKSNVKLAIYSGDKKVESLKTTFIAPPGMN
ncbi:MULTISPECIES: cytochrome c oxidase accessory protein CcoG [Sphingobacterium]|jgi:cytochrome c oxidase accessory protein FixG|uniref:cytochrome c oxidase accessory protein CcoG n=1 Tax=Sphingobacterium TaxID=28453 RepID=UPI000961C52E|nr:MULTISPECIES: cytochrome c oxidase accessory protein CcoG [Sphingobacterium]OJY98911.1 MAG: cytochrome c oxidase accessory protein CcoG [Sphingobacterium sp. 40-24]